MSSTPVAAGRRTGGPFANLKVAQKLFAAFGVLCALLIGVGALGIVQLQEAQQRLEGMYRDSLQATAWLGQVRTDVQEAQVVLGDMAVHTDDAHLAALTQRTRALDAHIDEVWSDYTATDMTGRETQRDAFDAALAKYRSVRDTQVVPLADNRTAFLAARNRDAVPLARTMNDALTRLAAIEDTAAQASMQQARDSNESARTIVLGLIGAALLIGAVLGTVVSRSIARPLAATVVVLEGLADGRLDQRLPVTGRDEVGRMAAALNSALDRLTGVLRTIGDNVGTLASSSEELSAVAGEMSGSAERSATQAHAVSAASEQISVNITTVAAGAEEIGASISEIARSTSSAAEVAAHAVRASEDAGNIVHQLGDSSAQIASVVKAITSIAEQTNLLALNATIEAARAGDAGKGFAVVAGEVKELATETARATEDISRRVAAIQSDSAAAVTAIAGIGDVIQRINDTQTAIAAAVEEQTATTAEMSRNVGEVATGSRDISANVAGVAGAAADTTGAAANTAEAANELARVAGVLQQNLAMFRY